MDDEQRYFKIPVKGTTYTFTPIPNEDVERAVVIFEMKISPFKKMKAITNALQPRLSEEEWEKLTDRLVEGEIGIVELTETFHEIIRRQSQAASGKPAKKAAARKRATGGQ